MAEYSEYIVDRSFDVMDMFDELSDRDKKEFLVDALRGLDYGDDYDVTKDAVAMLDDYQHRRLIKEAFDTIDDRLPLVSELADKLSVGQREELKRQLDG